MQSVAWQTKKKMRLDNGDRAALAEVVGEPLAEGLLLGWSQYGNADALRWFQTAGIDLQLSRKILDVYGKDALPAIQSDPYRLLAFGVTWPALDFLAQTHFGLPADDARRLTAALEHVLYNAFDGGDTYCERDALEAALERLIGRPSTESAMELADKGDCVHINGSHIHSLGPYLIEQSVAEGLKQRLNGPVPLDEPSDVTEMLKRFEKNEAISLGIPDFALNTAQRSAVHAAVKHPMVLITGPAGTGKSTVLKAVCHALEYYGQRLNLMALSGRAAKRITEVTGRPATTIAHFLRNVAPSGLSENSVVVIDEASMLDILLAYRLLRAVPDSCRLILIGDPNQLPPVGPGLTLHALISVRSITRVELTEIRRFGGAIATAAHAVREGRWPDIAAGAEAEIAFLSCAPENVAETVLKHFLVDSLNTQILTFTRKRGPASAKALNILCQNALAADQRRLLVWNEEWDRQEDSGLRMGEPVLCTRNFWNWDLQNGSIGRIQAIEDVPQPLLDGNGERVGMALAWAKWDDGKLRPITEEILDALELSYAVTVHKSQGSQFPRVLIPVYASLNLDRNMLYTAITRSTSQVLLIGDARVFRRAVEALPHAARRRVALADMLYGGSYQCS